MALRVAQVIGSFHQGGSERQAVQLVRLLHGSGHYRVTVACLDPGGPLRAELDALSVPVYSFPLTSFHDRTTVQQMRRFVAMLRDLRADVVQTHDYYTNMFGTVAASLAGTPVRIASLREISGVRTRVQSQFERIAFSLAHAVVVNGEAVRRHAIKIGIPPNKVALVHNALDAARVAPTSNGSRADALALLGLPRNTPPRIVTIVANMEHAVKDQRTFLRAAQKIHAADRDAVFVLAGDGKLRPALEAFAAELCIRDRTYFLGSCRTVGDLLAVSNVSVLSSRAEGFSNAILEYMAAGQPVVATHVGGAGEAIVESETGYLVPPGDADSMAERILRLLRDPVRAREMGARGRMRALAHYSTDALLENTEHLYARMLSTRRR